MTLVTKLMSGANLIEPGDILLPVTAGRLQLRNRVVMPAHTTNFGVDGKFSAKHFAYHQQRAAGGVGLIITEGMRVHSSSLARSNTVAAMNDSARASMTKLAEVVHAEGAKLAGQILHVGRQAGAHGSLTAPWSASAIPWNSQAPTPHIMTSSEISRVVDGFAQAALYCEQSGMDAIEVHLGHGHLLQQFLSPATNVRTDHYGGDLDNRMRMVREVLTAVTHSVSSSMPLILRISGDEFIDGGLGVNDMLEITQLLLSEFAIDLLHVSHSAYVGSRSIATQIADMSFPEMPFINIPRRFKVQFPDTAILAVCRVDNLDNAQQLIDDSSADLVALARGHIAEPRLVQLRQTGESDRGRHCIACNQGCTGRLESGLPISCVVNPEVGLESHWAALRAAAAAGPSRTVLVIGGGPAGMEAAVTAASIGHRVTLAERSTSLGGCLALAAALPMRSRFAILIADLEAELRHNGVLVELSTEVTPDWIDERGFDHVIEATGADAAPMSTLPGLPVVALSAAIADPSTLGEHVVIVDQDGGWTAIALADRLLRNGSRVSFLSANPAPAWRVPIYSRPELLTRLAHHHCQVALGTAIVGMEGDDLIGTNVYSPSRSVFRQVNSVVFVAPRVAGSCAKVESAEGGRSMDQLQIGDAYAPRGAMEAVYEGRLAGLAATDTEAVHKLAASLRGQL